MTTMLSLDDDDKYPVKIYLLKVKKKKRKKETLEKAVYLL